MRRSLMAGALALATLGAPAPGEAVTFNATLNSIRIAARPGQVVTRLFELTLPENEPATAFTARAEDWWRSEDGKRSFYAPAGRLQRSCGRWVSVNPMQATVEPGGTLKVRLTVNVPAELDPGGYWCALTVDEVENPATANADIAVRFLASVSVGIFVYIEPVERAGEIADVVVSSDEARITVNNQGNAPLAIEGRVEFLPPGAAEGAAPIATVTVPRHTLLTEPARTGVLTTALPDAVQLPSGRYLVRTVLDIGLDYYIGFERELEIRRITTHAIRP